MKHVSLSRHFGGSARMRTMLSMWTMAVLGALGTHVTGARAGLLAADGTDNRCTEHRSLAWCVLSLAKGAEKLRDTNQELIEQAIQAAHKKNGSAAMSEDDRVDLAFSSLEIGLGLFSNSASGLRGGVIDLLAVGAAARRHAQRARFCLCMATVSRLTA